MHTAALFTRMGISFLDIKKIEVKLELYELAAEEVRKSDMTKAQKSTLIDTIEAQ
jgi:hypothetical protein